MSTLEIKATPEKVIWSQPDRNADPHIILATKCDGKPQVIVGPLWPEELAMGCQHVFYGSWKTSAKYGEQFKFESATLVMPKDEDAVKAYLAQAPGVGKETARRLWDKYGEHAVDAAKEPASYKGLMSSPERVRRATAYFQSIEATQEITLALNKLFAHQNLPTKLKAWLIADYGVKAVEVVEANPFVLLKYDGVGFLKADALWKRLQKPLDSLLRGVECAVYATGNSMGGSVWHDRRTIHNTIDGIVGTKHLKPAECIDAAVGQRKLAEEDGLLALACEADCERQVASLAVTLMTAWDTDGFVDDDKNVWPAIQDIRGLSEHQAEQLAVSLSSPLTAFSGGPGTGKTHTLAALIRAIVEEQGGITVSAPTGKAAVRCTEALLNADVPDSVVPTTHHTALGWTPAGFRKCAEDQFRTTFHFLDEQSMNDQRLMRAYLEAVKPGSAVMFILDTYQLPPVGKGKPVLDLLGYGIPCGVLTESRRSSGRIVKACAEIRQGGFTASKSIDLAKGENLYVTETDVTKPADVRQAVDAWLTSFAERGYDPAVDTQVMAMKRATCDTLNSYLQERLNPDGQPWAGWDFKVGDLVMCGKNNNYKEVEDDKVSGDTYVANGEQGYVTELTNKYADVRFRFPSRTVRFTKSDPVALAWCITVHKSQGSEWPTTITICDGGNFMGNREIVTTGVSRAQELAVLVGRTRDIRKWVQRSGVNDRTTKLIQRCREFGGSHA